MNTAPPNENAPPPSRNEFGQPIGFALPDWKPPPRPPRETLTGAFCRLEPLDPGRHAAALFDANTSAGGDKNWTYLAYGPFQNLTDYRAWMEAACTGDDPLFFAIIDLTDNQPAGVASYLRITPGSGSIEVGGINYATRLQRTPAATEAMYLLMKHAFALGYRRYEWKCDALNAPSRAAAQRLGFSFEGVFRQATVYKNRNRDTAWFAITDTDWPALNAAFQTWLTPDNFDSQGKQRTRLADLTRPLLHQQG
ncbi:MAG TPA: GNAT family protein [Verrucomicrobiales bacterium]|nr:GNAT family protein [Verrucomicrobiales bacterium]